MDDLVKLRVLFKPADNLPAAENVWAAPVEVNEGGGTYRLENNSFMVAMAAGDLVRAELDSDGVLQVTGIVRPANAALTVVGFPPDMQDVGSRVDRWVAAGAVWTESHGGVLATVWADGMGFPAIEAVIQPDLEAGAQWLGGAGPGDRTADNLTEVDFELDRTPRESVTTTYWAAEDPWWAEHGLDNPEVLAYIQRLAGEDARIARALERGQQDRVMTYLQRISAPDPSALPPLDGPLFDEE